LEAVQAVTNKRLDIEFVDSKAFLRDQLDRHENGLVLKPMPTLFPFCSAPHEAVRVIFRAFGILVITVSYSPPSVSVLDLRLFSLNRSARDCWSLDVSP
jgi:hypothetical protein